MKISDFHLNKILKMGGDKMGYDISSYYIQNVKVKRIVVRNKNKLSIIAFEIDNKIMIKRIVQCNRETLRKFIEIYSDLNYELSYEGEYEECFAVLFKSIGRSDIYKRSFIFELWELFGLENPFSELIEELI